MPGTVTPPPQRRRSDLLSHLPALRASLEEQREARARQLTELLQQEASRYRLGRREPLGHGTVPLIDAVRQALGDIELALHRIHAGRYGTCLYCGSDMPLEQLRSAPQAEACRHCHGGDPPAAGTAGGARVE